MNQTTRELWQLNKYAWMTLAFVLIYLPVAHAQHLFDVPIWVAWVLFALAIGEGTWRALLAYRRGTNLRGAWSKFFNGTELLFVTGAVAISGGIKSDLWLLYFVIMMFESLYATPRAKRILDLYVIGSYLVATLPHQLLVADGMTGAEYGRLAFSRLFFLIMVSALARRISANAEARSNELSLLRAQKAASEERARIAREVHDSLGHSLVSSILRLELCSRLIGKAPDEAEALLKEEVTAIRAAWSEGRDLAFHLRPWESGEESEDLANALRRHISRFAERTGLVIDFVVQETGGDTAQTQPSGRRQENQVSRPPEDTGEENTDKEKRARRDTDWRLRPAVTFGLTRIVQEGLTNAVKHAHGADVAEETEGADGTELAIRITLARLPGPRVRCTIADNGRGFAPEGRRTGMGLEAMRERAVGLGGTFDIASAPGQGTILTVTLPE